MRQFIFKPESQLTEQDFVDYPAWSDYYEPDDIQTLGKLGFDVEEVREAIAATGYSDDYVFALPVEGCSSPFHLLMLSLRAVTPSGVKLVGYSTYACLTVFHKGKSYSFNRNLRERAFVHASQLAQALSVVTIFPLSVRVVGTSEEYEYQL